MIDWSHLGDWHEYSKLLIALVTITNPLSTVPVFLGLTRDQTPRDRNRVALAALITVIAVLGLFALLGRAILDALGITLAAFRVGGGVLIALSALNMVRAKRQRPANTPYDGKSAAISLGIMPVAIPLTAGPGAISTVILFTTLHGAPTITHQMVISVVIVVTALVNYAFLYAGQKVYRAMGETGLMVLSRVMGLLLLAVAVEFIADGIAAHFLLETIH